MQQCAKSDVCCVPTDQSHECETADSNCRHISYDSIDKDLIQAVCHGS